MTKFDELQQTHQHLLDRMDEAADKAAFVREVQGYVSRVCEEAVDVSAPRERDQLRANLRYWASYLYDATGTYPNTTMRPAAPGAARTPVTVAMPPEVPAPTAPPPQAPAAPKTASPSSMAAPGWRTWLLAVIVVLVLGVMYLWVRINPQTGSTSSASPGAEIVKPSPASPGQTLTLTWRVITAGPSPFNPNIWVARIELSATGGNDEYIFWVNGQRLPEASNDQFTVESQGCQMVSQFIGVTSGGQSARQELVIYPPEPNACSR